MPDWIFRDRSGSAQALHDLDFPKDPVALRERYLLAGPALVFGSSQRSAYELAQTEARRVRDTSGEATEPVELAVRRSGGGAVFLHPDAGLWVDLWIPHEAANWAQDLTRTFLTIGGAWSQALSSIGIAADMIDERQEQDTATVQLARKICYAGLGWGEVLVDGSKVIGLSQRRTRWGARVQCLADFSAARGRASQAVALEPGERERLEHLGLFREVASIDTDTLLDAFDRQLRTLC